MTKEQFEVLLKAKNIMLEQADDAISYLRNLEIEESVKGHYDLYLSSFNNLNYKVSERVLKSVTKLLPTIADKKIKGIVFSMMVADAVNNEKYNNAIAIYYEYKKLNITDDRLDYNFDNFMLTVLGANRIFSRYRRFSHSLEQNPYITKMDPYVALTFYYNNIMTFYYVSDKVEIEKNYNKVLDIKNSHRDTDYPVKCQYIWELLEIFYNNFSAKNTKDKENIASSYKKFLIEFEGNPVVNPYDRIDAHVPIIEAIASLKDYKFVVSRIKRMLKGDMSPKVRIDLYKILVDIFRVTKDDRYIRTLELLNKLVIKQLKKDQESVNEGLINNIRFHEVQQSYREIQERYETDQLTGCYSRNVIDKKTDEIFITKQQTAFIFFDLDDLKQTNDEHNHSYGDQYLRTFVNEVGKLKGPNADLFRYGGDEFVLVIPDYDFEKSEIFIKEVLRTLKKPIEIFDQMIKINFSAGIALYPQDGSTLDELLRKADNAMYLAKKNHLGYMFHKS